jgi:predicted outer membrane protein
MRTLLMLYSKIVATALTLLPSLPLPAQREVGVETSNAQATKRTVASAPTADQLLASWLVAGCDNEAVIARLAVQRSQSVEVKKFAQMMVDDHAKLSSDLKKLAVGNGQNDGAKPVTGKGEEVGKPSSSTAEASGKRVPPAGREFDHIALIRDLSDRCRAAQVKKLEAMSADKFDHGFMSAQVDAHAQAIIMVEVFRDHASDGLRPTLERTAKTLRIHLAQATTLCDKLEVEAADAKPSRESQE